MEAAETRSMTSGETNTNTLRVQSIYVDDTDLLWVGTEKSGVAYYGNNIYRFYSTPMNDITAIAEDENSNIYYGTSNEGIIGYNGVLASKKVTALECTKDGSLWVGSKQNGLTRIKNGETTIYSAAKDSLTTLIDDHINSLCTDHVGNLWIATNGGLQVYNPKMNTFSSYTKENGKLNTNNITTLFYARDNNLLVGTSEGLSILNLSTTKITNLTGNAPT
jgi:ligand-binding sensor domain-containing protein